MVLDSSQNHQDPMKESGQKTPWEPYRKPKGKNRQATGRHEPVDCAMEVSISTRVIIITFLCLLQGGGILGQDAKKQIFSVDEGRVNANVGRIGEGLPDNFQPPYTLLISDNSVSAALNINPDTGDITANGALDREQRNSYKFGVYTDDMAFIEVTVIVRDINDNPPVFKNSTLSISLAENTPTNVKVSLGSAVDPDDGPDHTIVSFEIVEGNDDNDFELSRAKSSGNNILYLDLKVIGDLNYAITPSYSLLVRVKDGGGLFGDLRVNITIIDTNNHEPIFNQSKYSATVWENTTVGTSIVEVFATDDDAGENSRIQYSIDHTKGDPAHHFRINSVTGVIYINKPLDYEMKSVYELTVVASDNGSDSVHSTSIAVEIHVLNINEQPANINLVFLSTGNETGHISENASVGEFVARISVSDPDTPGEYYSNITVTLQGGFGYFGMTSQNNVVYLVLVDRTLDRETTPFYNFTIIAADSGVPPLRASRSFTLFVDDINDNPPKFTEDTYYASVDEIAPPGSQIRQVTALDADIGENARVTYSIMNTPLTHSNWFTIDQRTGLITTRGQIDCETNSRPQIIVVATDGGNPPMSSTATVLVTVRDVNDNQPVFEHSFYSASVLEDANVGLCILQVSAVDPDCGMNAHVSYYLPNTTSQTLDVFELRPETGQLCVRQSLDYEHQKRYEFPIMARDSGTSPSVAMVMIEVVDVNDITPEFYPQSYSVNMNMNAAPDTYVVTVHAADMDSGTFGQVSYSISSGNGEGVFQINTDNGVITLAKAIPPGEHIYNLHITARDGGGLVSENAATVLVSVTGPNHNPPEFHQPSYHFSVEENVAEQFLIGSVGATVNGESVSGLQYSIASGDQYSYLTIDPYTGEIRTARLLDHDTHPSLFLNIKAQIGNPPVYGTTQVNITITDVNDNAPTFNYHHLEISVKEDTTTTEKIFIVQATDKDSGLNGTIHYSIENDPGSLFNIDSITGNVYLTKQLDYEARRQYNLTIVASDQGSPFSKSSNITVLVEVQDVNDNAPHFSQKNYNAEVIENAAVNTNFFQVNATDRDTGNNGRITYSLLNPPNTKFGIFPVDGFLYVNDSLNREERDSYTLRIRAVDNGQPVLSSTATVHISIIDANDNTPVFSKSSYHFSMVENEPRGSTVGFVSASDDDIEDNARLEYSFIGEHSEFIIHPHSGEITTMYKLDRESASRYEIGVRVKDQGNLPKSSSSKVFITILDVNDNSPTFQKSVYNASIAENLPKETSVLQVVATDPDLEENGTVSYHIETVGDAGDHFTIHSKTGWITTREVLDYETKSVYFLRVFAKDNGTPTKETPVDIKISVKDDNDEMPVFSTHNVTFTVFENTPVGTVVGRVQAHDRDSGENGRVSYYVMGGNVFGIFAVNMTTGEIYSIRSIDYEESSSHSLGIKAIDNSIYNPLSSTTRVEVLVLDVNDNPPMFDRDPIILRIRENSQIGYSVYTFTATDKDSGLNGTVGYFILNESSEVSYFNLEPQTGELKVARQIDYEEVHEISLIIQAHDLSNNVANRLNATLTVVIFILDENDNAPVFKSYTSVAVLEDEPVGYPIIYIVAIDDDSNINNSGNNVVMYSISSGNDDKMFSLHEQSGLLTIAKSLDRETKDRFLLNISACDEGSPQHSSNMILTIEVVDINDNAPRFDLLSYQAEVMEREGPGADVITVHATDGDTGTNGQLTYFIPQGIADDKFTVDSTSGSITTTEDLDREVRSSYTITVYVRDGGYPTQFHMTMVFVNVTDVNDHHPVFKDSEYTVKVPENTGRIVIHTFAAYDADSGLNGQVVYSISAGDIRKKFSIDRSTGQLSCAALDRENKSRYELTITAVDQGVPQFSAQCTAFIYVLDQNDNKPVFERQNYSSSILENADVGSTVLQVTATDPDKGLNGRVTYSLTNDTAGLFQINSTSGIITTTGKLDREKKSSFSIEVVAKDGGVNTLQTSAAPVKITIEDVNDNSPVFQNVPYMQSLSRNTVRNTVVLTVEAEDKDASENARVSYAFGIRSSSLALQYFQMASQTGVISTSVNLDGQAVGYHNLEVIASDHGQHSRSSTGIVTVVVGSGLGSPELRFANTTYVVDRMEHPEVDTPIIQVLAHYTSTQTTAPISYRFASGNDDYAFNIQSATGIITVNHSELLDYETEPQRQLVVMATGNNAYGYCTVLVTLQDVNDNEPKFTQESYVSATWEEMPLYTYVTQVLATDSDEGQNAEIIYKIISGDDDHVFDIIPPESGLVVTVNVLDYHTRHFYHLQIEAKDQGQPQLSSTCVLNITVVDTNNQKPYFPPTYPVNISEGLEMGSLIAWVTATDVDENPPLTYSFRQQYNEGTFSIDPFSGKITLAKALDRELQEQYELRILANDSLHTDETTLTVFVEDENDNPPVFTHQNYQVTLKELSPPHTHVITVIATDLDKGRNSVVTYRLGSSSSPSFYITPSTGAIYTNNTIQYSPDQQIVQLSVIAKDQGNPPLSTVIAVHIQIARINRFPPEFTLSSYSVKVSEDSERGLSVVQVNAVDRDGDGKDDVNYRIIEGNVQNAFNINRKSGQISLNIDLDREILSHYSLSVLAEDRGIPTMNTSVTVIVTVDDVNDQAPYFLQKDYYVQLDENFESETTFLTVTATDNDIGLNADIYYAITSGNDEGLFIVNGNTGELLIMPNESLDYEKHTMHKLIVRATDCSGCPRTVQRLSAFATILVNVSDVNEFVPVFPVPVYSLGIGVEENQPVHTPVFQAVANDKDAGLYGIVQYSIVSTLFTIDPATGWVYTNTTFNYESTVNIYQFQITAQDNGGLKSQISVIVDVKDVDEYQPVFLKPLYSFEVLGNAKAGTFVGFINATDNDGGDAGRLVYKLDPPSNNFSLEPKTGVLTVRHNMNEPFHRMSKRSSRHKRDVSHDNEKLTAVVSSGSEGSLFDSIQINVTIDRSCELCAIAVPVTQPGSELDDWIIIVIVIIILFVAITIGIAIYCVRTRHNTKTAETVSEVFDGSFDEPYTPPHLRNGNVNCFRQQLDSSVHSGTRILSDMSDHSHNHSNSSGRGSAEEEEDEEIKMINSNSSYLNQSNGLRGKVMPDSGIIQDDDMSSEVSAHQYLARLGIDSTKIKSKPKAGLQHSVESMHQFSDEGGGEATGLDLGNVEYNKMSGGETDTEVPIGDKNKDQGFHEPEPQHIGSLSSVINNEEEYSGSYNWDYLLDWGPQYQPLAHVFAEIARLKDDTILPRKQPVQTIPQQPRIKNQLNTRHRTDQPPMFTNVPPKPNINFPSNRSSHAAHSNSQQVAQGLRVL
ncbi:hypothetical protein ScPMuIL_010529 [Solemya velum]